MSDSGRNSADRLASAASADSSAGSGTVGEAQTVVRFRVLPNGEYLEARELGWKGRVLKIVLPGQDVAFGAPLEVESESLLYLGELFERDGPVGSVLVEHSLDRAKLATDRDHWG